MWWQVQNGNAVWPDASRIILYVYFWKESWGVTDSGRNDLWSGRQPVEVIRVDGDASVALLNKVSVFMTTKRARGWQRDLKNGIETCSLGGRTLSWFEFYTCLFPAVNHEQLKDWLQRKARLHNEYLQFMSTVTKLVLLKLSSTINFQEPNKYPRGFQTVRNEIRIYQVFGKIKWISRNLNESEDNLFFQK